MQFPNLLNIQENIIATILSGTGILIGVLLNQFIFTKIDKHYNEKKKIWMNELMLIFISISIFGALPLVVIGLLISFKRKRNWINGVDQDKLSDPESFGKYVGNSITLTGVLMFLVSMCLYLNVLGYLGFVVSLTFIGIIPLPALYIAKSKYS